MKTTRPSDASALEARIGYAFKDRALLMEALTHKSFHHEYPTEAPAFNERLEFLGDSVLGLVIVERLFGLSEGLNEAEMSKLKSFIVKGKVLSAAAGAISLGEFLRMGKGEVETGGRAKPSLLSNALEALIGAVYLDGGFDEARALVMRLLGGRLDEALASGDFHDYKTELQEVSQDRSGELPDYRLVAETGTEHSKVFEYEVFVGGERLGRGVGKSKKEAQEAAAKEALKALKALNALR